jgi:hypothetical protein
MWRVPIIGALLGHALDIQFVVWVLGALWLIGFVVLLVKKNQRYLVRFYIYQILISVIYWQLLTRGFFMLALLMMAAWIAIYHKMLRGILIRALFLENTQLTLSKV